MRHDPDGPLLRDVHASAVHQFHRVNVFVTIGWATQYADIADQNDCGVAARVGVDRHTAPGDHQMA